MNTKNALGCYGIGLASCIASYFSYGMLYFSFGTLIVISLLMTAVGQ